MKVNKIYFSLIAMLAMMLTACSSDDDYTGRGAWDAADGYADVEFVATSYNLEIDPADPTTMQVKLARRNTSGAVNVPITVTNNDDDVFTVGSADFADGEDTIDVNIDFAGAEIGTTYKLQISLDDKTTVSQYTEKALCDVSITRVKWNDVGYFIDEDGNKVEGYAMYREDFTTAFFGVDNIEFPTRIQERDDKPGYFRLINTYGEGFPYNEPGDYDADNTYYIFIDATDPEKVFIPSACQTGMDWGYGMFYIHSFAGYYLAKNDEASAEDYYGTYENGMITFPKGALLIAMADYNDGGLYPSNPNGLFRIVIDPSLQKHEADVEKDFEWEEVFDGEYTSDILGTKKKAKLYKGTCVNTTDDCDKVFAENYGTAYKVESAYADGYDIYFCVAEDGSISVPDGHTIQPTGIMAMASMVYAKVNGGSSSFSEKEIVLTISFQDEEGKLDFGTSTETLSNITYTPVGTGTYTYTCLYENVSIPGYVLSKRDDKDNVYKISEWGEEEVDLIFTWDKETNECAIDEQYYCMDAEYGAISVADIPTWQGNPALAEAYPSYYDEATSTFHFNVSYFVSAGSFGYGEETFKVTFNSNATAAPARKTAKKLPAARFSASALKAAYKRPARLTPTKTNIKVVKNTVAPFAAF